MKRIAGILLLLMSTMLFCTRYISAAFYGSGVHVNNQYSDESFKLFLSYTGKPLLILSIISLILGSIYIIWAELEERGKK